MKGKEDMAMQGIKPGEAIWQMNSALIHGYFAYTYVHNWRIAIYGKKSTLTPEEREKKRNYPPNMMDVIANWRYAKDMEYHIDKMSPAQKAKETEKTFDNEGGYFVKKNEKEVLTYEDLVGERMELGAGIRLFDENEEFRPLLLEVINTQLQEALDRWEKDVTYGEYDDELFTDAGDACDIRDKLENVKWGIDTLRLSGHLMDLPYYKEYCKRLKELDVPFKKLLDGETVPRPYADKVYWWRQPSSKK